ncbi:RICIN domain-containing protein [Streptomyces erythrochromogenes]|uniref:RICIN domain-containing protein n=1 Tax=Streptomyces erythrochromogenes TaxID=285574 RepID=UPI00225058D4|nr:RICIN domain-containing protein [Streptomyces erythrochromogenes]MCX5589150.1 RICIN domain-containing protein [Streptomyces erythrochromogenes]
MRRVFGSRVSRRVAALTVAAAWLGAAQTVPASATAEAYQTTITHSQSGKCLDGSLSQGVRLVTCDSGAYQQWIVSVSSAATIKHVQSGKCLDGSASQGIRLVTCDGGAYQQWTTNLSGYVVKHVQSGRCLDGSVSQGVRLITCSGANYQAWYL